MLLKSKFGARQATTRDSAQSSSFGFKQHASHQLRLASAPPSNFGESSKRNGSICTPNWPAWNYGLFDEVPGAAYCRVGRGKKNNSCAQPPTPAASKAGLQYFHFACSFLLSPQASRTRSIIFAPGFFISFWSTFVSIPLSRSLSQFVNSSHLELFFFLSFLFLKDSVPASPRLPTSSFNSSSTSVFVIFLSHRTYHLHTYNIRAALGIRLFHSPCPTIGTIPGVHHIYLCSTGTSQQQIPTPFLTVWERKLTGPTSRRREYNIVILGAGKQQLSGHASI